MVNFDFFLALPQVANRGRTICYTAEGRKFQGLEPLVRGFPGHNKTGLIIETIKVFFILIYYNWYYVESPVNHTGMKGGESP